MVPLNLEPVDLVEVVAGPGVIVEQGALVGYPGSSRAPVILEEGCHIHAGAVVYAGCRVGRHSHVYHHTVLLPGTTLGAHTKIGALCVAQGDLTLGDWVTVASHCHLTSGMVIEDGAFLSVGIYFGNARFPGGRLHPVEIRQEIEAPVIRRGARIGAGTSVNPGVVIGQEALIGTGSVVTRSVPDFAVAFGVPARVHGSIRDQDRIDWTAVPPA